MITARTAATPDMIAAVKAVLPSKRLAAAKLAERIFVDRLATLTAWDDFNHATHVEMAGKAAAAEVAFRFA